MNRKTKKKYLAVLGGSLLSCPAIKKLEKLGYKVLLIDGDKNAPAKKYVSKFVNVDFSDTSKTLASIKNFDLEGIISLNDFGVLTASTIANEKGLKGWSLESANLLINKKKMKEKWIRDGLKTARFACLKISQIIDYEFIVWDCYPCIVKPNFSGGGSRGVALVKDF